MIPQEIKDKIEAEAKLGSNARTYSCHPGDIHFLAFISGGIYGYSLALPRIKELEQENERLRKLVEKKDEYINLLGDEISELASVASVTRGWKSTRYEAGKKLREEIQALAGKKEGEV